MQPAASAPYKAKKPRMGDPSPSKPSPNLSPTDRGKFLDDIIAAGAKSADLDALAVRVSPHSEASDTVASMADDSMA